MSHARHIGRVGALAVALGVGVAVAAAPGIAHAQPSDSGSASSPSDSSSAKTSASTGGPSAGEGAVASAGSEGADSPASVPESVPEPTGAPSQTIAGGDGVPVVVISSSGGTRTATDDGDDLDVPPAAGDDETAPAGRDDDAATAVEPASGEDDDSADRGASTEPAGGSGESALNPSGGADDTEFVAADDEQSSGSEQQPLSALNLATVADTPARYSPAAPVSADALAAASVAVVAPAAPVATVWDIADDVVSSVVNVATQLVSAVVTQLLDPAPGSTQSPLLWLMAAFARREFETLFNAGPTVITASPEELVSLLAADTPNVLIVGVDGTNLSKILADTSNTNFFGLIQDGTTAASDIVGHTTISNPSWAAILTGVWSERLGVINNVFTPWTFDTWPTVFNQLETLDPTIETTAIGDSGITALTGAGSIPPDNTQLVDPIEGDTHWLAQNDAVGDALEAAITAADPQFGNFIFGHFVAVDKNGHEYGGDSPEYAAAVHNVDENLGEILAAVETWETLHGEQWTVIVVTDHGHVPVRDIVGSGHGFQSPRETSTFVIAEGPGFAAGNINLQYEIVDVTPTVMTLFGFTPAGYSDGVSLTTLGDSNVVPVDNTTALRQALQDAIARNGWPDPFTTVALNVRTLFSTVPWLLDYGKNAALDELQGLAGIPVVGGVLAAALSLHVNIVLGGILYEATNIPAQIVARLTGVTGNQIIPPDILSRLTGGLLDFQLPQLATAADHAVPACENSLRGPACVAG